MDHSIRHDLDAETVRKVTDKALSAYQAKFTAYNATYAWGTPDRADISFAAKGLKLNGAVTLKPGEIQLELDVPFLLRPLKGTALKIINEEITEWIGKAKRGEV